MKKIKLHGEVVYLAAIVLMAFSVAMLTAVDFGISMIVAPAYILSVKISFLSFGTAEYVVQGVLFIVLCILLKGVKPVYFVSFLCCLLYGAVLDLFRSVIPAFNPASPNYLSDDLAVKIPLFVCGVLLTSLSVAMFFRCYLYPQVYDFFVAGLSAKYSKNSTTVKTIFDVSAFALSIATSYALCGELAGVGWGTLIMAFVNGPLIGLFGKFIDRFFVVEPIFHKFSLLFVIS